MPGKTDERTYEYDVVLSFAGEDRAYVQLVAKYLLANDVSVFYDENETVDLWGKDLYQHLDEVYRKKGRYCVIFLSEHYREKLWPKHELSSAQARAFEEAQEYILPARFDDTEVPGVRPTLGYIDIRDIDPAEFGAMIVTKIRQAGQSAVEERSAKKKIALPRVNEEPVERVDLLVVDPAVFKRTALDLLRIDDDIEIRTFLYACVENIGAEISGECDRDKIVSILDRISCFCAMSAIHRRVNWVSESIEILHRIYDYGFTQYGHKRTMANMRAEDLWFWLLIRVASIGALFVRLSNWEAVRALSVSTRRSTEYDYYGTINRHALTEAARSHLFTREMDGRRQEMSLLLLAKEYVEQHDCLSMDIGLPDELGVDSLCQYDFLVCLLGIAQTTRIDSSTYYPSFAKYRTERTTPITARILADAGLRSAVFPLADDDLAAAMREINSTARHEGLMATGWMGYDDPSVKKFLADNPHVG